MSSALLPWHDPFLLQTPAAAWVAITPTGSETNHVVDVIGAVWARGRWPDSVRYAVGSGAPFECLDEQTLVALMDGQLDLSANPMIEAHLAKCTDCLELIAAAAMGVAGTAAATPRDGVSDVPQIGEVLAEKYRIEGVLGRGGMGVVLEARHLELGQKVALKLLHSAAPMAAARFLREAKISAQLVNEHIARVFDLGRLPNGVPFIVMEHLVGEDLSRVIARGPVRVTTAVDYVLQACRALAEAHSAGVVHRDLKPANLFITHRVDGSPWLKILDFGVSKRLGRSLDESQSLTVPSSIMGSPVYMSPEQIRASKELTASTDIWSLGVVLYELLTGRRPFRGETLAALAVSIATETPPSSASLNPAVPPWLDAVLSRCLNKEPSARFHSISELARALSGDSVLETRLAFTETAARRKRPRQLTALLLVCLACGAALTARWLMRRAEQQTAEHASVAPRTAQLDSQAAELRVKDPVVSIHCDSPVPTGVVRLFFHAKLGEPAQRQRSVTAADLCRAGAPGVAPVELSALLDDPGALTHAALDPPHPFYSLRLQSTSTRISLELARAALLAVRLTLQGAACRALRAVEVMPATFASIHVPLPRADASSNPPGLAHCNLDLQLPFEAFGKRLRFRFAPSGYSAPDILFAGSELETTLVQPKRSIVKVDSPEARCLPPHYYNCRE